MAAPRSTKGPNTGALPKGAASRLREIFFAVEESMLEKGVPPREAAQRSAQIAWSEIKRDYYKRGDRWVRRKRRLPKRNPIDQVDDPAGRERLARLKRSLMR